MRPRTIEKRIIHEGQLVVLVDRGLVELAEIRTDEGYKIHIEIGEPDEYGYHILIFNVDFGDMLEVT